MYWQRRRAQSCVADDKASFSVSRAKLEYAACSLIHGLPQSRARLLGCGFVYMRWGERSLCHVMGQYLSRTHQTCTNNSHRFYLIPTRCFNYIINYCFIKFKLIIQQTWKVDLKIFVDKNDVLC